VTEDLQRAEARYAEAIDDLRRFERRMALAYMICFGMIFVGLLGLVILKVIQ
jgi:hypothetical protein